MSRRVKIYCLAMQLGSGNQNHDIVLGNIFLGSIFTKIRREEKVHAHLSDYCKLHYSLNLQNT